MQIETIKIKNPVTGEGYTIINKSEFKEGEHELFEETSTQQSTNKPTRIELDEALAHLPEDYTDASFVVTGMRKYFGDLFTDADETRVRELVKPLPGDTDGDGKLTVPELKAFLDEKKVTYAANAKKSDLVALYEQASKQ